MSARGSSVLLAAALLAASALPDGPADARPGPRERLAAPTPGVVVDVSRLRALGLGEYADIVGSAVTSELAAGGAGPPAGGRLVVRLTGLSLPSFAGSDGGGGGGGAGGGGSGSGGNFDYLEGEVLVVGAGGEVLSRRPQTTSLSSTSGGPYYVAGFDRRRADAVGRAFAAWVRRGP